MDYLKGIEGEAMGTGNSGVESRESVGVMREWSTKLVQSTVGILGLLIGST